VWITSLLLWQNIQDKQLFRRKGLFWLIVSEVSVHVCLALLLCTNSSTVHHGGRAQKKRPVLLKVVEKQKEREVEVPLFPSRMKPNTQLPSTAPPPKSSPPPNSTAGWGSSLHHMALGDMCNLNYSTLSPEVFIKSSSLRWDSSVLIWQKIFCFFLFKEKEKGVIHVFGHIVIQTVSDLETLP
jgi:hypothetical protein